MRLMNQQDTLTMSAAPAAPRAFTAARISSCLGRSPQGIRKALEGIRADGRQIVQGREALAWGIGQLPAALRGQLEEAARCQRFASVEALLSAPAKPYEPPLPLSQIAQADIDYACSLREAMAWALANPGSPDLPASECERRGIEAYAAKFGRAISSRYWRELLRRTLERDGGLGDFCRLEIFLPSKPSAKTAARLAESPLAEEFQGIQGYIDACQNPLEPSKTERRGIWGLALEKYEALAQSGLGAAAAARRLRKFLFARAPFLAPSREALAKAWTRKQAVFEKGGRNPKALRDRREENGDPFELPENDAFLLVGLAARNYRGNLSPAWRDLLHGCPAGRFSAAVVSRYSGHAGTKSHVPAKVRHDHAGTAELLWLWFCGQVDDTMGHIDRSYDGIPSMVCSVWDDFTMPCYYYAPDGNGWFVVTRGQILLAADFRSLCVIGWSMQPQRNYDSLTIRSLCTHVFAEHGIPLILYFERGIWQNSALLKGRAGTPFTETEQGLKELGIKFIHATTARAKTVERVGGLLQDLMGGEPGYCGRDERRDAPEGLRRQIAEVETRKTHPSRFFYSFEEWQRRFGEIVDKYNHEPQEGKILAGLSPSEAMRKFADESDPPRTLTPEFRYLLANHKAAKEVTLNGITFKIGKRNFNYRGESIAHLVGRTVLAWFDPENPEEIVVTDMNRKNPIAVGRSHSVSALECLTAPGSGTLGQELRRVHGQASHIKAYFKAVKADFPMPRRALIPDARARQLGGEMEEGKAALRAKAPRLEQLQRRGRALGVPSVIVRDDAAGRRGLDLLV